MKAMEAIRTIGSVAGAVITIVTFIALLAKPVRNKFAKYIGRKNTTLADIFASLQEQRKDNELIKSVLQNQLRNTITIMYYKYMDRGSIPLYEHDNLMSTYDQYRALNGNSYACKLYEELMELPIQK